MKVLGRVHTSWLIRSDCANSEGTTTSAGIITTNKIEGGEIESIEVSYRKHRATNGGAEVKHRGTQS